MNAFDFHNIISGNGIMISITGMLIVFCGLLLISFSVWALPKILALFDRAVQQEAVDMSVQNKAARVSSDAVNKPIESGELDLAGIIGFVLQLEDQKRFESKQLASQPLAN